VIALSITGSLANATLITFPIGTPVTTTFDPFAFFFQSVDRDGFRFRKQFGSLSINTIDYDGAHPQGGGLYVGDTNVGTTLWMSRLDGQPFGLLSLNILERNSTTGLRLTLGARPHGGSPFDSFEEEFPFDLDTTTYDTFDVAAADPRFASVDYVAFFSVESPLVDPSETNYIIDHATVSFVPEPVTPVFLALGFAGLVGSRQGRLREINYPPHRLHSPSPPGGLAGHPTTTEAM
jgi:hypothetical protein